MFSLDQDCRIISLHRLPQEMQFSSPAETGYLVSLAAKDNASFLVLAQNKPYGVILPK